MTATEAADLLEKTIGAVAPDDEVDTGGVHASELAATREALNGAFADAATDEPGAGGGGTAESRVAEPKPSKEQRAEKMLSDFSKAARKLSVLLASYDDVEGRFVLLKTRFSQMVEFLIPLNGAASFDIVNDSNTQVRALAILGKEGGGRQGGPHRQDDLR